MPKAEVLIIGAGPTGLVLALWLAKSGVKARIIDRADRPGTTSRAIVIHARNLEFYQQMGIAHIAVDKGIEIKAGNLWVRGRKAGHVPLNDIHARITPFQFMLGYPQDQQEELLEKKLAELGVIVERSTALISYEQRPDGVRAHLRRASGETEECDALYLAGCDGARSVVREELGVGFPGGTYEETFYVADLRSKGLFVPGEVNIALDDADFLAIFPLAGTDAVRLVGTIRQEAMGSRELKWEDVSTGVIRRLKMEVEEMKWFSTYRVHHRVAAHFRSGNIFLLGDAGHIHSPVGGQGMNTGIGDAVNLGWKIAAVVKGAAPAAILDTYEPERIAFARQLVATTDRAFTFVSARGRLAAWIRLHVVPFIVPQLFSIIAVRRYLFRILSQTLIRYPDSVLSAGAAGGVSGGDRLPWVPAEGGGDNFAGLAAMNWQVHIYGEASAPVRDLCRQRSIPLQAFAWSAAAKDAGLKKNAVYIIRPDGYVGLAEPDAGVGKITAYMEKWGFGKKAS